MTNHNQRSAPQIKNWWLKPNLFEHIIIYFQIEGFQIVDVFQVYLGWLDMIGSN